MARETIHRMMVHSTHFTKFLQHWQAEAQAQQDLLGAVHMIKITRACKDLTGTGPGKRDYSCVVN